MLEKQILTDFAAQVPQLKGPIIASRYDACVVKEEAGREYLPTVTRERVLQNETYTIVTTQECLIVE